MNTPIGIDLATLDPGPRRTQGAQLVAIAREFHAKAQLAAAEAPGSIRAAVLDQMQREAARMAVDVLLEEAAAIVDEPSAIVSIRRH